METEINHVTDSSSEKESMTQQGGGPPRRGSSTDDLLRDFIREQREADVKGTLMRMNDNFVRHYEEDKVFQQQVLVKTENHGLRIAALENDKEKIEDKLENTGNFRVQEMQERIRDSRWLPRLLTATAIALASGVLGAVFDHFIAGGK